MSLSVLGVHATADAVNRLAEMGLNGSNDFSVKASSDTGQWREAIKIDHATGNVAVGSI